MCGAGCELAISLAVSAWKEHSRSDTSGVSPDVSLINNTYMGRASTNSFISLTHCCFTEGGAVVYPYPGMSTMYIDGVALPP